MNLEWGMDIREKVFHNGGALSVWGRVMKFSESEERVG